MDRATISASIDQLAKPPGSLGRLENIAIQLALTQQTRTPVTQPRQLVLFAADHGVTAEGVSQWPQSVTQLVLQAVRLGRAGSSVLANATQTPYRVVDVGINAAEIADDGTFRTAKVNRGTRNLVHEPAMTLAEFEQAWAVGVVEAIELSIAKTKLVIAGEMGIGNTTAAACLAMLLADVPLSRAVGRGAGADDATLAKKTAVVQAAVDRVRQASHTDPRLMIAAVAGFEIVAMAGFYATAAQDGMTILLDGYIATAAALIAERLHPGTTRQMIAGHLSAEPGHGDCLAALGLEPILHDWQLRLGEGTGALLALPMLDAAAAMLNNMMTLSELLGQP